MVISSRDFYNIEECRFGVVGGGQNMAVSSAKVPVRREYLVENTDPNTLSCGTPVCIGHKFVTS